MSDKELPIGVFDSGSGGLTVCKAIREVLPNENIIYFGDLARFPYGNKSRETIQRYSYEISNFLIKKGVKLIVVACNSASSMALDFLKERFNIPIIGVIEPGVKAVLRAGINSHPIGVIGTKATIESSAYKNEILKVKKDARVVEKACPLFVPLIEEGWIDHPVTRAVIREYIEPLKNMGIKDIILGCTHYPLIKEVILDELGGLNLIDLSKETASVIKEELNRLDLVRESKNRGWIDIYISDKPSHFRSLVDLFLGDGIRKTILVSYPDFEEREL